ncbi:MAG: hypothetical protein WD512_14530 [Candidatus Paceibacterota bacterium]
MRLYFTELKENKLNDMPLDKCVTAFKNYMFLISLDGVYKTVKNNNSLSKMTYIDKSAEEIKIDKWNVLVDKSQQSLTDNMWRIPYDYKVVNVQEETYMLREKSDLKFIILRTIETKTIVDYYFSFNGDVDNFSFKEDIRTFLSDIK